MPVISVSPSVSRLSRSYSSGVHEPRVRVQHVGQAAGGAEHQVALGHVLDVVHLDVREHLREHAELLVGIEAPGEQRLAGDQAAAAKQARQQAVTTQSRGRGFRAGKRGDMGDYRRGRRRRPVLARRPCGSVGARRGFSAVRTGGASRALGSTGAPACHSSRASTGAPSRLRPVRPRTCPRSTVLPWPNVDPTQPGDDADQPIGMGQHDGEAPLRQRLDAVDCSAADGVHRLVQPGQVSRCRSGAARPRSARPAGCRAWPCGCPGRARAGDPRVSPRCQSSPARSSSAGVSAATAGIVSAASRASRSATVRGPAPPARPGPPPRSGAAGARPRPRLGCPLRVVRARSGSWPTAGAAAGRRPARLPALAAPPRCFAR